MQVIPLQETMGRRSQSMVAKRPAGSRAGFQITVVALALAYASGATAEVVVSSAGGAAQPGQTATVAFAISGTRTVKAVATYQAQVAFNSNALDIDSFCTGGNANGAPCSANSDCLGGLCAANCSMSGRLAQQTAQFSRPEVASLILFIGDTAFPIDTFGDGDLLTCTFNVRSDAPPGNHKLLTTFLEVADASGDAVAARAVDGSVIVDVADRPVAGRLEGSAPSAAAPPVADSGVVGGAPSQAAPAAPAAPGAPAVPKAPAGQAGVAPARTPAPAGAPGAAPEEAATPAEAAAGGVPPTSAAAAAAAPAAAGTTPTAAAQTSTPAAAATATKAAAKATPTAVAKAKAAASSDAAAPPAEKGGCQLSPAGTASGCLWLALPALVFLLRRRTR